MEWVIFDGPIDTTWVESLNTVLDDTKKLCFSNGESMKISQNITTIFEVDDISHASPATISRCGMVFLEAKNYSSDVYLDQWLSQLTPNLNTI